MPTLATRQTTRRPPKVRPAVKIFLALVGALLLNVLALFLAVLASTHWPRHRPKIPTGPLRVTIVPDTAPTPEPSGPADAGAPTPPPYMRTLDDQKSDVAPKDPAFESHQDTLAASMLPADGNKPLPSQQGRELPTFDFDPRPYRPGQTAVDAATAAPPAPSSEVHPPFEETEKPPETKKPPKTTKAHKSSRNAPQPIPAPDGDLAAAKTDTATTAEPPVPSPQASPEFWDDAPPPTPQRQSRSQSQMPPPTNANVSSAGVQRPPGYQPQSVPAKMTGNINNRGKSAVAAIGTPLGRYMKSVYDAVGMLWYFHGEERAADISAGSVTLQFIIDRSGHVKNVRFTAGKPNGALGIISEQSINDAIIDPIPPEVVTMLQGQELEGEIDFSYY